MAVPNKRPASVIAESEYFKKTKIKNIIDAACKRTSFLNLVNSQDENKDPCRESEFLRKSKRYYPSGEYLSSSNRNRGGRFLRQSQYNKFDSSSRDWRENERRIGNSINVWEKDRLAYRAKNFGNDVNLREKYQGVYPRPYINPYCNQFLYRYHESSPFLDGGPNGYGTAVSTSRDHRMTFYGSLRTDYREPFHSHYRGSNGARNSRLSDRYDCQRRFDKPMKRPDLRELIHRDRIPDDGSGNLMMSWHDHLMKMFDGKPMRSDFRKPFRHHDGRSDGLGTKESSYYHQRTNGIITRKSKFRRLSRFGDNRRINSTAPKESNYDSINSKESVRFTSKMEDIRLLRYSPCKRYISRNPTGATTNLPSLMSLDTASISEFPCQAEPFESSPVVVEPAQASQLNYIKMFEKFDESSKKPEKEENKKPENIFESLFKPGTPQYSYLLLGSGNPAAIAPLYRGNQCDECGVRFAMERGQTGRQKDHLDCHFRQNRQKKNFSGIKKINSRPWYCRKDNWIQLEKIENLEDRDTKQTANAKAELPSVPTSSGDDGLCRVCNESFEQFFNEEEDEWHLRSAVAFEEKSYHPLCLEDYKKVLEESGLALDESRSKNEEDVEGNDEEKDDKKMEDSNSDDDKLCTVEDTEDVIDGVDDFSGEEDGDAENDEPVFTQESEKSFIAEAAAPDTTQITMKSSIDGNVELDSIVRTIPAAIPKIQLKNKVLLASKKPKICLSLHQDKQLMILPVERGELTGLCSIM